MSCRLFIYALRQNSSCNEYWVASSYSPPSHPTNSESDQMDRGPDRGPNKVNQHMGRPGEWLERIDEVLVQKDRLRDWTKKSIGRLASP
jgi:hypothetical protein